MTWDNEERRLVLGPFKAEGETLCFTLNPLDLNIRVLRGKTGVDAGGVVLAHRDDEARRDALLGILEAAKLDPDQFSSKLAYRPPSAGSEPPDSDGALYWSDLWSLTQSALERVAAGHKRASPVRVWPHHFDMAVLIPVGRKRGKNAQSVGLGLAPDDAVSPVPYFYAAPWPPPHADQLGEPPEGWRWQSAGFTGLIAETDDVVHGCSSVELGRRFSLAFDASLAALGIAT